MSKLILVRAALTAEEWKQFRMLAVQRDTPTSQLAARAMRALLKGAKP